MGIAEVGINQGPGFGLFGPNSHPGISLIELDPIFDDVKCRLWLQIKLIGFPEMHLPPQRPI